MAATFGWFLDSAKSQPLTTGKVFSFDADGSTGPVDAVLYLGSTTANRKIQASTNPGVDNLVVSVADAQPGSGQPSSAVKLALTSGGLDTATGGAALDLGITQLLSSEAGFPVYVRYANALTEVNNYADLSLQMTPTETSTI